MTVCRRFALFLGRALLLLALLAPSQIQGTPTADFVLEPLPENLPRHFGVIGVRLQGTGDDLRISHVRVNSPADSAGVLIEDLLRGADGYRLTTLQETLDYMQSREPNSTVTLHLVRAGQALQLPCRVTDRRHLYGLMLEEGAPPPARLHRHDRWLTEVNVVRESIDRLIEQLEATQALDSLRQALMADAQAYGHDGRLPDVDFALQHPSAAALPVVTLADDLMKRRAGDGVTTAGRIESMAARLPPAELEADNDGAVGRAMIDDADTVFTQLAGSPLYDTLLNDLWHTGQLVTRSLPAADPEMDLLASVASLIDRFDTSFYLGEGDREETLQHIQILRWAKKVDLHLMAAALARMAALSDPTALRSIRKAARNMPVHIDDDLPTAFSGDIRYARHTAWGWLIIGGKGSNVYAQDAACIIDLGGDDLYLGGGRVAATFGHPVGLIIDLGGDDRYIDRRHVGVAAAIAGVAAIIDTEGDDLYEGAMMAQAAAFAGGALLVDQSGDDVYLSDLYAQGSAMFGLALLLDEKGADLYSAAQFAQGFAGPGAIATLLDEGGSDRYVADRSRPSSYGTAGIYNGWSQGVGCGLRGFAAGGLGLL
ncbi:MAG: PDZ domain-containing protein, partial [Gemmatimonadetes bacterium]|nr:PDZ domain-containing protein [Gemmatimonadota bacterium]